MARPHADPQLLRRIAIAVFEHVAELGVEGASVRGVARRANLSTGTLTYHYKTKDGLLRAALDYAYRPPADWKEHEGDARSALRRLARRYVLTRPEIRIWWRFWCSVTAYAASDAEVAARHTENQRALIVFFAKIIQGGVDRGELRKDLVVRAAAERFSALAHGLALRQLVEDGATVSRLAERLLFAEIDSMVG